MYSVYVINTLVLIFYPYPNASYVINTFRDHLCQAFIATMESLLLKLFNKSS